MIILIKAAQFLCSLTILVLLHEFGHYIAARAFGVRVEKFYLFFNPWFSLFKKKIGDTEWGIGWLPLGGYAKIAGMVDESMDTDAIKKPPQPYEFRAKQAWKRLIIILAGIVMNLITAWIIYSTLIYTNGENYLPTRELRYGIVADSLLQEIGFKTGDKLLYVNGKEYENYADFSVASVVTPDALITVIRDEKQLDIRMDKSYLADLLKRSPVYEPRIPLTIGVVRPNSPADNAGLHVGDSLISINDTAATFFDQLKQAIRTHKGDTLTVDVMRNDQLNTVRIPIPDSCIIGIAPNMDLSGIFQFASKEYSLFASLIAGARHFHAMIKNYWNSLKLLFVPEAKAHKSVGGFISIGKIFPSTWDWTSFWSLTAFLSLMLAVMNLLPIPALDGGHAFLILIELITGKKLGTRVLVTLQLIGMFLLFLLLIYANVNDVLRLVNP